MIVICYGMPKSASSFTFQLAAALVDCKYKVYKSLPEEDSLYINKLELGTYNNTYTSLPERVKSHFFLKSLYIDKLDQAIYDLVDTLPSDQVLVIKTHSPLSKPIESVLESGNALAIVNYRNPYDIIVSLKDVGERERLKEKSQQLQGFSRIKSIDDAKALIPKIIKGAKTWLDKKSKSLLYVSYQSVEKTPFNVAWDINEFLQLNLKPNSIDTIVDYFISDKSKIKQYNIGVSGRGAEISFSESDKELVEEMDSFVNLYLKK
jgi:hypothetical protein